MLAVQTQHSKYGRVYQRSVWIDETLTGSSEACWCRTGLRNLAGASQGAPMHSKDVLDIASGLKLLVSFPEWRSLLETAPHELKMRDVLASFRRLEHLLIESDASSHKYQNISRSFRGFIKKVLLARNDCPQAQTLTKMYRPLVPKRHRPRGLISDMVNSSNDEERRPLGAIPHSDVAELRRRTASKIHGTLRQIQAACQREFDAFDSNSAWLQSQRATVLPPRVHTEVAALIGTKTKKTSMNEVFARIGTTSLLAGYLQYFEANQVEDSRLQSAPETLFPGAQVLMNYAASECFGYRALTLRYLAAYPEIGDGRVLVACLLAIQIHAGWNVSSVLGLTLENIQATEHGVLIQGFKTRTGDHTPLAHISSNDALAMWAIRFLERRLAGLRKYGFISTQSKSLWLTHRSAKKGPRVSTGFPSSLRKFQERHHLPLFSFDQIRPEVIAASVVQGEAEDGRRIAGHRSISATGHYLDQLLLHHLNSSINLEFQKRLERSVRWMIDDSAPPGASRSLLDLTPIGDGASCRDPKQPPVAAWLEKTECKAQNCHQGDGCPNREIHINFDRIREVSLTTKFYRRAWREMAEENWQTFEVQHLPAIIFNAALTSIIRGGPYGFVLRDIEGETDARA